MKDAVEGWTKSPELLCFTEIMHDIEICRGAERCLCRDAMRRDNQIKNYRRSYLQAYWKKLIKETRRK